MTQAPDIRFIGMEACGALASVARDRALELGRVHAGIMSCQIAIEQEPRQRASTGQFRVRVGLVTAPGHRLTEIRGDGDDVYAALRSVFDASRLQLEHAARRRQ